MGTRSQTKIKKAMVDRLRTDIRRVNSKNEMKPVHYGYLMAIKEKAWVYKPAGGGYLPYRTYIWAGAKDAAGNALWCFAYGEREWIDGKKWVDVLRDAGANKPGARLSTCP